MPTPSLTWTRAALLACGVALSCHAARADTRVLVNPGDRGEQTRLTVFGHWRAAFQQALAKADAANTLSVRLSTDASADLGATRAGIPDIVVGPAHLIGSAVRYGYTPVFGMQRPQQTVLAVNDASPIRSFAQMQGTRLGVPHQDSLVTYLVRGEANAANTTVKRHFSEVYETRYQEALLICLRMRRCDVVAVERSLFDRWKADGEAVRMVMESRPVPALSVAVKKGSSTTPDVLRRTLADAMVAVAATSGYERPAFDAVSTSDFAYVSTLGYFTPRALTGATVVDAASVEALLRRGARYIDTRNQAEFDEGHVEGATLVPYVEKSAKDPDFIAALDQFDTSRLGKDLSAELIFGCNGAECWKSHKASIAALKAGYTRVYWFRGGFPEWRAYRAQGADQLAKAIPPGTPPAAAQ